MTRRARGDLRLLRSHESDSAKFGSRGGGIPGPASAARRRAAVTPSGLSRTHGHCRRTAVTSECGQDTAGAASSSRAGPAVTSLRFNERGGFRLAATLQRRSRAWRRQRDVRGL